MSTYKKNNKGNGEPIGGPSVAPGMPDARFGEKASRRDIKKGNYTRITRAYLDENDPS